MDLTRLIARPPMVPWRGVSKIPWNEADFSQRMLREHLTQTHGMASRQDDAIDRQVAWIHDTACDGEPTVILDLGCGPGMHTARLAERGHRCTGIDFSPASIRHARAEAGRRSLPCTYIEDDLRTASLDGPYDVVLMLFGEFDTFAPDHAASLLGRIRACLRPGGALVLEVHTLEAVQAMGRAGTSWFTSTGGLHSRAPHVGLRESRWHPEAQASTERTWIVEAGAAEPFTLHSTTCGRTEGAWRALLREQGFDQVSRHPAVGNVHIPGFYAWVAR